MTSKVDALGVERNELSVQLVELQRAQAALHSHFQVGQGRGGEIPVRFGGIRI
jgi:hypothetical protein